jgi:hypothetical protein
MTTSLTGCLPAPVGNQLINERDAFRNHFAEFGAHLGNRPVESVDLELSVIARGQWLRRG